MAGATSLSPLINTSLHDRYKQHTGLNMLARQQTPLFSTSPNVKAENGLVKLENGVKEDPLSCLHCNFTCKSSNAMTQHRWEVHPLLMRRKQHLMSSSIVRRKRQQSETLTGQSSGHLNNPETLRRKVSSEQDTDDCLENSIRKKPKASSLDDLSNIEVQGHSRSHSVGSTSLKSSSNSQENSMLANLCKKKILEHNKNFRQMSPPANQQSPILSRDSARTNQERPRYNDGLDALASAALKMESDNVALLRKKDSESLVYVNGNQNLDRARFNPDYNKNTMFIPNDNLGQAFPIPDRIYQDQIIPLPRVPFILSCLPTEGTKLAASLDPRFLLGPSLQAASIPFPLNSLPTALYNAHRYHQALPASGQHYVGHNLSTLSDVASQLLSNDITSSRKFESQTNAEEISDEAKYSRGYNQQNSKKFTPPANRTEPSSNHAISKPINIVQPSVTPSKRSKKESSPDTGKSQGAQLRHLVDNISLKDDRMKPLEDALRNADCCDFNERSSIMPFRCKDGSWKMVRTKRIGGAWLVQMPGKDSPSVYFPNSNQKTGSDGQKSPTSSINALLYNHNAQKQNPKPSSPKSTKRIINGVQGGEPKRTRTDTMTSSAKPVYATPSNDVIRNLLLQKTALTLP